MGLPARWRVVVLAVAVAAWLVPAVPAGASASGRVATAVNIDPTGLAIDPSGNLVIANAANGRTQVVAARDGVFYGRHMTAGDIYTVDAPPPGTWAVDAHGNYIFGSSAYNSKTGEKALVRVVAASTGTFYGRAMTAGDTYTIASAAQPDPLLCATYVTAVVADTHGNVVFGTDSECEQASQSGTVQVIAGSSGTFYGQVMTAGQVTTITNDPADRATGVSGVALDRYGNIVIGGNITASALGDFGYVFVLAEQTGAFYGQSMTAGDAYVIAGKVKPGKDGANGRPAAKAALEFPTLVAVDSQLDVMVADNHSPNGAVPDWTVRMIAEQTGTLFGQRVIKGDIYTVAGIEPQ